MGECSHIDSCSCVYGWPCVAFHSSILLQCKGQGERRERGRSEKYRGWTCHLVHAWGETVMSLLGVRHAQGVRMCDRVRTSRWIKGWSACTESKRPWWWGWAEWKWKNENGRLREREGGKQGKRKRKKVKWSERQGEEKNEMSSFWLKQ